MIFNVGWAEPFVASMECESPPPAVQHSGTRRGVQTAPLCSGRRLRPGLRSPDLESRALLLRWGTIPEVLSGRFYPWLS